MKKILYTLLAATALLATAACQRENKVDVDGRQTVDVTFNVGLADMQTKAFSDGKSVDFLRVLVYAEGDNGELTLLPNVSQTFPNEETPVVFEDKEALQQNVTLKLVKGMNYSIVFWAQKKDQNAFSLDEQTGILTVKPGALLANDDALDAFYAKFNGFSPQGTVTPVQLKRPFAQINLLSSNEDYAAAEANQLDMTAIASDVTVTAPSELNLASGEVGNPVEFVFGKNAIAPFTWPSKGWYVGMAYVLAGEKSELDNVKFTIYYKDQQLGKPIEVKNVPFQRNYRTNIMGNVFTTGDTFGVTIAPGFADIEEMPVNGTPQTVAPASVATIAALPGVSSFQESTETPGEFEATLAEEAEIDLSNFTSNAGQVPASAVSSNEEVVKVEVVEPETKGDAEKVVKLVAVAAGEADVVLHYAAVMNGAETKAEGDEYNPADVTIHVTVAGSAFTTIAELNELVTKDAAELSGELTDAVVSFVPDAKQAIIKDATGSILLYKSNHGLKQGQTFSGKLKVTAVFYKEWYSELTALDAEFEGEGAVVEPETVTLAQLKGNYTTYQNAYVKVAGLKVTAVNGRNVTVTDGTNEYVVYCQFGNSTNAVDQVITATGTVTKYNTTEEIKVWTANAIEVAQAGGTTKVLTVAEVEHGTVSATIEGVETIVAEGGEAEVEAGKNVTLTAEADENYELDSWVLTDAAGQPLDLAVVEGVFAMPEDTDVVVSAVFKETAGEDESAFTTIAELNGLLTKDSAELKGELTDAVVSFVPATNQAIIKDATGSILLYKKNHGLKQGQTFSGKLTVTGILYNGLYSEITALDAVFVGDEAVVEPETVTLAQLKGNYATYQNAYVKVAGLEVTAVNGRNITVTDGENEYVVYCQFGNATNVVGQTITATGTVTKYNTTEEIKVWTSDAIVVTAEPAEAQSYSIKIDGPEGGSIKVFNGETELADGAEVAAGTTLTLQATAAENYSFSKWVVTNSSATEVAVTNNQFVMPEDAVTISAVFKAAGEETSDSWVAKDFSELKTGDVVAIVATTSAGTTFAMSNDKGTSSAPAATSVTISDTFAPAENLQFVVTVTDGEYQFAFGEDYLYCTNTNNGVRIGSNDNNKFIVTDGYLVNKATSRYVGVYNSQDWRCYTSINNNIKDQTFKCYVKPVSE